MGEYMIAKRPMGLRARRGVGIAAVLTAAAALALAPTSAWAAPTPDQGPTVGGTTVTDTVPKGVRFTSVSTDLAPSYAVGDDGNIYAWGGNGAGQVGDGTTTTRLTPVRAKAPAGVTFTQVSGGEGFALAIGSDGNTYSWGQGQYGQLGAGSTADAWTPTAVQLPAGVTFTQVDAGAYHSVALGSDGNTYAWGLNSQGRLGDGTSTSRTTPVKVQTPVGVAFTKVEAGGVFSLGLTAEGDIYAWGQNFFGELGNGTTTDRSAPVKVVAPAGVTFAQISAGGEHAMAISATGVPYAWGWNDPGTVGNGTSSSTYVPTASSIPAGVTIAQVSAGGAFSSALATNGQLYVWGQNAYGVIGNGTTSNSVLPLATSMPAGVTFTSIDAGASHVLAVGSDGNTYSWGYNIGGNLGDGTTTNRLEPGVVDTTVTVTNVAFDGIPGANLGQADGSWSIDTPAYCGPSDVVVEYTQFGVAASTTFADGFTFGAAPVVTENPASTAIVAGSSATLSASADGDDAPTVQWQQASGIDGPWEDVVGATSRSLTVTPTAATHYRAVFTNCRGEATTAEALVSFSITDVPTTDAPTGGVATPISGGTTPTAGGTLAITGAGTPWVAIAFGGGLLVIGAGAMIVRRRLG